MSEFGGLPTLLHVFKISDAAVLLDSELSFADLFELYRINTPEHQVAALGILEPLDLI